MDRPLASHCCSSGCKHNLTIRELMEEQRSLVRSSYLAERLAAALLISGVLRERLRELDDVLVLLSTEVFAIPS
jgi:hypothetical protein